MLVTSHVEDDVCKRKDSISFEHLQPFVELARTFSVDNIRSPPLSLPYLRQQIVSSILSSHLVILSLLLLPSDPLSRSMLLPRQMPNNMLHSVLGLDSLDVLLEMISSSLGSRGDGVGD